MSKPFSLTGKNERKDMAVACWISLKDAIRTQNQYKKENQGGDHTEE